MQQPKSHQKSDTSGYLRLVQQRREYTRDPCRCVVVLCILDSSTLQDLYRGINVDEVTMLKVEGVN